MSDWNFFVSNEEDSAMYKFRKNIYILKKATVIWDKEKEKDSQEKLCIIE